MTLVLQEVMNIPFHYNEAHVIVILSSKNTDSEQKRQKIQTGEMFSKKRRNAIKTHKQNIEQGKNLTDSEQKIEDQAARKSPADFPLQFSLPSL